MIFISFEFLVYLVVLLFVYYSLPINKRWLALLIASVSFYFYVSGTGLIFLLISALSSFFCSTIQNEITVIWKKKVFLTLSIMVVLAPLLIIKEGNFVLALFGCKQIDFIVPLGISFYTLQIIAYLLDCYSGVITPEKNIFRYLLFVFYFPQIVQGPIPRFKNLASKLYKGFYFDERVFTKGLLSILWGWFLKMMIADKAGVIVDTIFQNPDAYQGTFVLLGGFLYSIQLYTDFQACVYIARGTSELFGIELERNFNHPYFSRNIPEFWRRWHITLSSWLRDYIYIPLGGNRKGKIRKYLNIMIVFVISGMWHGAGYKFILWGFMHGIYQVIGGITAPVRTKLRAYLNVAEDNTILVIWQQIFTFICVMFAWIIFRANSLRDGIKMLISVFTVYNPWVLFNDSIFKLGLAWKECVVLAISMLILLKVSLLEEKESVRDKILNYNIVFRWMIYIGLIFAIIIFGTYGYGFDAKDFIYGGF